MKHFLQRYHVKGRLHLNSVVGLLFGSTSVNNSPQLYINVSLTLVGMYLSCFVKLIPSFFKFIMKFEVALRIDSKILKTFAGTFHQLRGFYEKSCKLNKSKVGHAETSREPEPKAKSENSRARDASPWNSGKSPQNRFLWRFDMNFSPKIFPKSVSVRAKEHPNFLVTNQLRWIAPQKCKSYCYVWNKLWRSLWKSCECLVL